MLVFLFTILSSPSLALINGGFPELSATLISQSPDPAEPGEIVTVKFKIENSGSETTKDVIVKLHPRYPFELYGGQATKNIGKLQASQNGADAVIVEYKVKIANDAVEGETELVLELIQGDVGIIYDNSEFIIDIETSDATLEISSIKFEPSQVAPGESAKIHITVKNLADSLLKDLNFHLDFDGSALPLAPYQSSSERRLMNLKPGFQDTLTFQVIASPDAIPGLYKVPLNITYNNDRGTSFAINDVLAVTIGDAPKLRPYIKKSTVLQTGSPGKITLGLANAGTTDLKFVEVELLESDSYQLVSTSSYLYIGDIDSDDTESEELDIYINKKAKILTLPIKLKYVDANNKPFQQQMDLTLNLYSSSQLKKFGLIEGSNTIFYILILLLIIGGYVYYKRYHLHPERQRPWLKWFKKSSKKSK